MNNLWISKGKVVKFYLLAPFSVLYISIFGNFQVATLYAFLWCCHLYFLGPVCLGFRLDFPLL